MTEITRTGWADGTDDTGGGQDGTVLNAALLEALADAIDALLHSATNPTIDPAEAIDELVDARGNLASLDARISGAIDDDGNPIAAAGTATGGQVQSVIGLRNFWLDALFRLWPDGDSAAPYGWTLSGTGAAIVRTGSGGAGYESSAPADTTKMKWGKFAAKITYGSSTAKITRSLLTSANLPDGIKGQTISVGIRCKASVASMASIIVDDGATQTRGGESGNGTYHSGSGSEAWIYCTHTVSESATKLDLILEVAQSGSAYFSCGVLFVGADLAPVEWIPERVGRLYVGQQQRGTATTGTTINEFRGHVPTTPLLLENTEIRVKTAPASQPIIIQVVKNGADDMYATEPEVAATEFDGEAAPDGAYDHRILVPGDYFTWDIDQVGSGTPGEEVAPTFEFLAFLDEFALMVA